VQKIRVGVIGVGYLGRYHAQKYAAMEDVELVGVADIDPVQAQRIADECSTTAYGNYREMLDKVDAVSIALPRRKMKAAFCRSATWSASTRQ
jgi:predicted dehydrogenase